MTTCRLAFVSDLHIDHSQAWTYSDYLRACQDLIAREAIDYFIIGGDISNDWQVTLRFVEDLQAQSSAGVYFIPGNHDYWQRQAPQKDSWAIHRIFQAHPQCLMGKPLQVSDNWRIIGHPAWYNHAVHDPRFSPQQLERGRFKLATWQDKKFTDWGMTDRELSQLFSQEILSDFQETPSANYILVTHILTISDFTVAMPHPAFDFFNAFLATDDLYSLYQDFHIPYSIMGHVHIRYQLSKAGTHFIANSLGYPKEWRTNQLDQELESACFILDLD